MTKKELIDALASASDDQEINILLWPQRKIVDHGYDMQYYKLSCDSCAFEIESVSVGLRKDMTSYDAHITCGDLILED